VLSGFVHFFAYWGDSGRYSELSGGGWTGCYRGIGVVSGAVIVSYSGKVFIVVLELERDGY